MKRFVIHFPLLVAADWFVLNRHYTGLIERDLSEVLRLAALTVARHVSPW